MELLACRLQLLRMSSALFYFPSVQTVSFMAVYSLIVLYNLKTNFPLKISECAPSLEMLLMSNSLMIVMPLTMFDSGGLLYFPSAALLMWRRQSASS